MTKENEITIVEEDDCLIVNGQKIYISKDMRRQILDEYAACPECCSISQFLAGKKLKGLVCSIGLPDFHAGYALPVGSIAVIDLTDPEASISPDGVGFDINCGVRLLKTNLFLKDIIVGGDRRELLGDMLVRKIPFGDISQKRQISVEDLNGILNEGMKHMLKMGMVEADDIDRSENGGSLEGNSKLIGQRAKARGLAQLGTLGSGNHYLEVEIIDKICDSERAEKLGLEKGQIVISIHTGSRGLGHGCCSDIMEELRAEKGNLKKDIIAKKKADFKKISEDASLTKEQKQLEYERITALYNSVKKEPSKAESLEHVPFRSELGQKYLKVMNSASNFAWANRSMITQKVREVFGEVFPNVKIEMVYDVCHNIGKVERIEGKEYLVLRKGASRILPPGHEELPQSYMEVGQPVLVGGSMGTCSYLIAGDENARLTYYSTCHGAGRAVSRAKSKQQFRLDEVKKEMRKKNIVFKVGSEEGMVEECSGCYKDVEEVVKHSEKIGVSKSVCRMKPILVIKG